MNIKISNNITVTATPEIIDFCKKELIIDNPDFITKKKMGFYMGNTPQKLHLYEKRENNMILPFGCLQDIWDIAKKYKVETDFSNNTIKINGEVELYDYQKIAVTETLKHKNGVLVSPAGSGKTQIGIAIIKELKQKTLWITHTKDLLSQSRDRLKRYLQCEIGEISEGKINIQDVTFATVQTMAKMDLQSIKDEFGLVIIDECHRLSSSPTKLTMFGKVISNLKARYKIGLTATAHRSDGLIRSLYAYIGGIYYEVSKDAVKDKTIKSMIELVYTRFELAEFGESYNTDGTLNFIAMIGEIAKNEKRNRLIANKILENKDMSCLVLSDRLSQLREIKNMVGYGVMIDGGMTSKKDKEKRVTNIKDMQAGKEKVLYASYTLAKEGLDIPCLERLFFASPKKDLAVIIQSVGRIERKTEKEQPITYDFVDESSICKKMFNDRKKIYVKNENKIVEG